MPEKRTQERLTVDLAGLREVRADLSHDTEAGLRPGLIAAQHRLAWGARFCLALQSAEGLAARVSVNDVLVQHRQNSEYQLRIAEGLVLALERIVENYANADNRAAARINEVETELTRAITQLEKAATAQKNPSSQAHGMLS
ncbi:hypothetical protein Cme02nite_17970 [Catellatospora methionotrophica]|uniref:Uncharacterized protein n=1 Tax=Catellatospora methionotrophica TaxID=121620 RepID=A0A8J3LFG4_9ACTN|nr:hypothetical protein [Catellatospora methionotrophica]GIG13465.1 hypothetical protein Cme02nite_17970 [Catellatospora methionotrophica]